MTINVTLMPHPTLFCGLDDWGLALDEINGAGWNDAIWVDTFDAAKTPLIMIDATDAVWEVDACIRPEDRVEEVSFETRAFAPPFESYTFILDGETRDFTVPEEQWSFPVTDDPSQSHVEPATRRVIVPRTATRTMVRRASL